MGEPLGPSPRAGGSTAGRAEPSASAAVLMMVAKFIQGPDHLLWL